MSVVLLAHRMLWEVVPLIHVYHISCSYIHFSHTLCHVMKTQLYFRLHMRCMYCYKCMVCGTVLCEGDSWAGCRGARFRGARDGAAEAMVPGKGC